MIVIFNNLKGTCLRGSTPVSYTSKRSPKFNEVFRSFSPVNAYFSFQQAMSNPIEFHPSFSSSNADIILRSADNVCFKVSSHVLCTTCGFFQAMLTLPQGSNSQVHPILDVIDVGENGSSLERFLRVICCMEQPAWGSHLDIEETLFVADKYDAPGAVSLLRPMLHGPLFRQHPLHFYHIATHFGWEEETKLASQLTLTLDLCEVEHEGILRMISSEHLLHLYNLHDSRKRAFRRFLNGMDRQVDQWPNTTIGITCRGNCSRRNSVWPNPSCWRYIQHEASKTFDKRPLGDTTAEQVMHGDLSDLKYWESKCTHCATTLPGREGFLNMLREFLDNLCTTV